MLIIDVQPITCSVGEEPHFALDAVDPKDGDFNGGKSGYGLLPLTADGSDAVSIGAEVDPFSKVGFMLCRDGSPVAPDEVVVCGVLWLPSQKDLVFIDLSVQFKRG